LQADLHLHQLQVRFRLPLRQVRADGGMLDLRIRTDLEATTGLEARDVVGLTERATQATFYTDGLTAEQVDANSRIPPLAGQVFFEAAASEAQHLAAAFAGDRLTGFMIATRHGPEDLELDWLMVDPDHHGTGLADSLMEAGIEWLGSSRAIWLTVIKHNARAISFYRRFGFEIDTAAELNRVVPTWIMRRPPRGE
jgi:ribosomal protein S18 acetylase RimI-like enzyme